MLNRLKRFYGKQDVIGCIGFNDNVSDDKTSMAEIAKRFALNQPLPETTENKSFEYEDSVMIDSNGKVKTDSKGNILSDDVLTNEVLDLIPITPNLDDLESVDADDIQRMYSEATDNARAFVRGKKIEESERAKALEADTISKLEKAGKVVSSNKVEVNKTAETPSV